LNFKWLCFFVAIMVATCGKIFNFLFYMINSCFDM